MTKLKMINMNDVEIEEVEWLWQDFIPYKKITLMQGDSGEGKTTALLQIIASLTTGRKIVSAKDDPPVRGPVNVIYQTAEDGLGDTIKPRLVAAGADCSRVLVIDDSEKALTMSDDRLEEAIIRTRAKLVVLDPIQAYLGSSVDMYRANEVRPVMSRISALAKEYGCAFVLIGHINKSEMMKAKHRSAIGISKEELIQAKSKAAEFQHRHSGCCERGYHHRQAAPEPDFPEHSVQCH